MKGFSCAGLLGLLTLTSACGGTREQRLEGSLSEVVDLRFHKAEIQQQEGELAVRFIDSRASTEDIVLRLAVSLLGTSVDPREKVDLAEDDAVGRQRGSVSRAVLNDPLTSFPDIERGGLTLQRPAITGETVPGEFHVTFAQGTHVASGRTVFGTFEGKVQ